MPIKQILCVCLTTQRRALLGFCSQDFRQAGPLQRVDCLAPMENNRRVSFPRTQRRIGSSGIERKFLNDMIL